MPLKKGHSAEIVSHNIKEMVKAGHPQKQAIAAAMAMKRKSMKMAKGGMVSHDYDEEAGSDWDQDAVRGLEELNELGKEQEAAIESPEHHEAEKMFAKKLWEKSEEEHMGMAHGGMLKHKMAHGGLVEPEHAEEEESKPELGWIDDGSEEPMEVEEHAMGAHGPDEHKIEESVPPSMGLSEEAKKAIDERKKKRRFAM
jgi:hypothetical protein